ncbi:DUF1192 family protein [Actinoplanes sp. NPDC051346]|uniref:DUF1192 family protein n=1 Tax=Actinoplanes sp. NPDC051346 TaxID=3155048 RepID=UPI0034322FA3
MGSPEELEQRIAAMEAEIASVRREAAAARALTAGANRDVAGTKVDKRSEAGRRRQQCAAGASNAPQAPAMRPRMRSQA